MKIEEIINKIVWYVPFRKKRDLLRNELNQLINDIIKEKNKAIEEKNKAIEEKNKAIEEKNKAIEEKNKNYGQLNKKIDDINGKIYAFNKDSNNRFLSLRKEISLLELRNKARMQILSLGDEQIIKEIRKEKLIVSLTTFPQRIYDIDVVLFSLLNQTVKPDKIILWLSREEFPNLEKDIPPYILNMQKFGIDIEFCNNLYSYNKIIHSLKKYPNDLIVVADDDVYYEYNWLEKLYNAYLENPNYIHCHRAHKIQFDEDGNILPYTKWIECVESGNTNISFSNFITNVGGALYKLEFLYKDVFNDKLFMELCPKADDIWCWAMAVLNGTKIHVVKDNINKIIEVGYDYYVKLWHVNKLQNFNDVQLNNVFDYYGDKLKNKINI